MKQTNPVEYWSAANAKPVGTKVSRGEHEIACSFEIHVKSSETEGGNVYLTRKYRLFGPGNTLLGLERLREEGEQFSISLDEAANYEYNGSPFTVKESIKEDVVISRFTELGGDDFDNLIAEELLNLYQDESPELSQLCEEDEVVRQKLFVILMQQAELLKRKLSDRINNSSNLQEKELDREVETVDLGRTEILLEKGYQRTLGLLSISKARYEEIINPFLGEEFSLNDLNKMENFDTSEQKNLIVPLLDVLKKFRAKMDNQSVPKR